MAMPVPMTMTMAVALAVRVTMPALAAMLLRCSLDELRLVGALFVSLMGSARIRIHEG